MVQSFLRHDSVGYHMLRRISAYIVLHYCSQVLSSARKNWRVCACVCVCVTQDGKVIDKVIGVVAPTLERKIAEYSV